MIDNGSSDQYWERCDTQCQEVITSGNVVINNGSK